MKAWIWRYGPVLVIMATIFLASGTPGPDLPTFGNWDFIAKKGGHMLGYALLAAACYHALNGDRNFSRTRFFIAFCLTVLYAMSDEWHQTFVSGRSPSFRDVGIDAIGGCISLALLFIARRRLLQSDKGYERPGTKQN
jgi:VanZ family protein